MKQFKRTILFDYNGTLFFDADINHIAWKQTIAELSNNTINFDELYKDFKSARNYFLVKKAFELLNKEVDDKEIDYWVKRKENQYYQRYCVDHNRNKLSPGAEELLSYLKDNGYPINLCTASIIENVNFYFDYLKLGRWFDKNIIAYDDGSFYNKTDMYKACAERIGANIEECVVVEDSPKSIHEAIEAGCKRIIAIKKDDTPTSPEIIQVVNDLSEVDYNLFNS